MKVFARTILVTTILAAGLCFGQALDKGNLVGLHLITVKLRPNVTMDEFKTFFISKVIPEYEKQWEGLQGYLVKSVRGEHKNRFAIIWAFKTEAARDRYFNADDTPNELEKAAIERVKLIEKALTKYGTYTSTFLDDWVVQ